MTHHGGKPHTNVGEGIGINHSRAAVMLNEQERSSLSVALRSDLVDDAETLLSLGPPAHRHRIDDTEFQRTASRILADRGITDFSPGTALLVLTHELQYIIRK